MTPKSKKIKKSPKLEDKKSKAAKKVKCSKLKKAELTVQDAKEESSV